jgi:fibro-slime domain-containing protein
VFPLVLWACPLLVGGCAKAADNTDFGLNDGVGGDQTNAGGAGRAGGSSDPMIGPILNTGDAGLPDPDAGQSPVDPAKVVHTEVGGYELGPELTSAGKIDTGINASETGCGTVVGIVRDFKGSCACDNCTCLREPGGHPDFESYKGDGVSPGLVASAIGNDNKPVYTGLCEANPPMASCPFGQETSNKANFDEWYRITPNVNRAYLVYLVFAQAGKIASFDSQLFFPLDNAGFGNSGTGEDQKPHNFGFTTEIHTKFKYSGGEIFSFTGDDDLWVFINGKIAVDLGGLHEARMGMVDLDQSAGTLGITKGNVYAFDLFHAERHTVGSHFHADTTLTFVDCGDIPAR